MLYQAVTVPHLMILRFNLSTQIGMGEKMSFFIGGEKPLQDLEEYSQYIEKTE